MRRRWFEAFFILFLICAPKFSLSKPSTTTIHNNEKWRTKRQTDDVLTTLVQLGSKIFPLMASLMGTGNGNVATSGQAPTAATSIAAGSTPAALSAPAAATALAVVGQVPDATNDASGSKPTIQDKVSNAPSKVDKIGTAHDPFTWHNLLSMGLKIALAVVSNYSSGGIDREGNEVSTTEAVLGTVFSGMTGSEDPKEVSQMAKQASEVVKLFGSLVDALKTSFAS